MSAPSGGPGGARSVGFCQIGPRLCGVPTGAFRVSREWVWSGVGEGQVADYKWVPDPVLLFLFHQHHHANTMALRCGARTAEERKAENAKVVGPEIAGVRCGAISGSDSKDANEFAQALPDTHRPWWKERHLLRLNAILSICCLSAATVGYDGKIPTCLVAAQELTPGDRRHDECIADQSDLEEVLYVSHQRKAWSHQFHDARRQNLWLRLRGLVFKSTWTKTCPYSRLCYCRDWRCYPGRICQLRHACIFALAARIWCRGHVPAEPYPPVRAGLPNTSWEDYRNVSLLLC